MGSLKTYPHFACNHHFLSTPLKMISFYDTMDSKHQKTLTAIFAEPTRANIVWNDIESFFFALGGEVSEGRGSRVRVVLNGVRAVFHRPHPEKETDKGAVKSVRRFLLEAGVEVK